MSSMPPEPPPPPPPPPPVLPPPGPPPPAGGTGKIPWEERQRYGFVEAFVETLKLFGMTPAEAWARTPRTGSLGDPLLFAILTSWVGAIFSAIYGLFFAAPWLRLVPPEMRDKLGMSVASGVGGMIGQVILAPIFIGIGLFIVSAILHLCVMVVGGLSGSDSGFEGTFRAIAYSAVADLANVIPFVGGFVAAIWKLVLVVMGLVAMHRMTQGKAIAAVLIPVVLCCGCTLVLGTVIAGLVMGALNR